MIKSKCHLLLSLLSFGIIAFQNSCSMPENSRELHDIGDAVSMVRVSPSSETWKVTCKDGSTEMRSTEEVVDQNYCHPITECQTRNQIQKWTRSATKPYKPLVVEGNVVPDIHSRFCLHKADIDDKEFSILIPDINRYDRSTSYPYLANFDDAQIVCKSLSIKGKTWHAPYSGHKWSTPQEIVKEKSLKKIGRYFSRKIGLRWPISFWSGSFHQGRKDYVLHYAGSYDNDDQVWVGIKDFKLSVICVTN